MVFWQEILTFSIIGVALFFLARRYFFKRKASINGDACGPCDSSSCEGCSVMDLKREIEKRREDATAIPGKEAEKSTDTGPEPPLSMTDPMELWEKQLKKEISKRKKGLK